MNRQYFGMAICLGLLLSSCSSYKAAKTYTFDKTQVYSQDFEQVWGGIVAWFAENSIPIKTIEKASGLIATEYGLGANDGFCDCGTSGTYQTVSDRTASFNVLVQPVDAGTRVTVTVSCSGKLTTTDLYGSKAPTVSTIDCNSTGSIESQLFEALATAE